MFWLVLIGVTLIWYALVTTLVAIRGGSDIMRMLEEYKEESSQSTK